MIDIRQNVAVSVPWIGALLEAKVVRVARCEDDIDREAIAQRGEEVTRKAAKCCSAGLAEADADPGDTISCRDAVISGKGQRHCDLRPHVDPIILGLWIRRRPSVDCDYDVRG